MTKKFSAGTAGLTILFFLFIAGCNICTAQDNVPVVEEATNVNDQLSIEEAAITTLPGPDLQPVEADNAPINPFQYTLPIDSKGFLPTDQVFIPKGIKVLGILQVENKKPIAAVQIPSYDDPFYVQEGDMISINIEVPKPRSTAQKSTAAINQLTNEVYYLEIGAISSQDLEIYPKTNPSHIQIIR